MSQSEVLLDVKTQVKPDKLKPVKKTVNRLFFAICFLFIVILALCVNNFILYRSYRNFCEQFYATYCKMKSATEDKAALLNDKQRLELEKESLKKENEALKELNNSIAAKNKEILKQMEEMNRLNEELKKKNKELVDDNIALQNSLKKAAAVGIKPQNYSQFNGITNRGEIQRGKYLGKFLGTAYTPSVEECGNNRGITNSGKPIVPGVSVAVDKKYWPYGTVFYIKGLGYAVAMDTGSAIKGRNRFDFAVFDKNFAKLLGARNWDVYLVKMGKGYVEDLVF